MDDFKATVLCHAHVSKSVHRGTVATCTTPGLILPILSWILSPLCPRRCLLRLRFQWKSPYMVCAQLRPPPPPSGIVVRGCGNEVNVWEYVMIWRGGGQVAQGARRLTTGWTARVRSRVSEGWRFFFSLLRVQTGHEVYSASYKMSTGAFPRGKGGQA